MYQTSLHIVLFAGIFFNLAFGLQFDVAPDSKRCVKEEIHKDELVTGEFQIVDDGTQTTSIKVTDSNTHIFYQKENIIRSGRFSFTSDNFDFFFICFESKSLPNIKAKERRVTLNIKHGVEAKNYDALAKAEKLKPVEAELKRLEDLGSSIVNDFAFMRSREEEMRDTNESTRTRVFYFSVFSILCLLGLATWQLLYMRRYFKEKRLLD